MLREREPLLREDFAPDERFAAGLRAALLREAPALDDFAREEDAFFVVLLLLADDDFALERLALARPDALPPLDFFAPLRREEELEPVLALALPSIDHFPDITR